MIVDPFELRARPSLIPELREEPGKYAERRYFDTKNIEVRKSEDQAVRMGGLALVYGQPSVDLGGFIEYIARGSLRKVLAKKPDVRALFNHDLNYPLARSTVEDGPGALYLTDKPKGLDYDFEPTPTSYANDLRVNMEHGVVTQSSFAFRVARGGDVWEEDEETGLLVRTIHEFSELYDVSPVTDPAYIQTTSGLRSRDQDGSQPSPRASAQQPGDEGDPSERDSSTETLQGGYLAAARQRDLRAKAIALGLTP